MNVPKSIFVVDDDQEDQFILTEYFKDVGSEHLLCFAKNGQEAIYKLENTVDEELPKLIVLDLNMPILNGAQTLLQLKAQPRFKKIPVIIFSTAEDSDERRKCLSYGASEYLVKPSTYERGARIVEYFLSFV
jgi:CheY-like chemotaxis protein